MCPSKGKGITRNFALVEIDLKIDFSITFGIIKFGVNFNVRWDKFFWGT